MQSAEFTDRVFGVLPWTLVARLGADDRHDFATLNLSSGRKALVVFSTKTRALHFIDGRPGLQSVEIGWWNQVGLLMEQLAETGVTQLTVDPEPLGYDGSDIPALAVRLDVLLESVWGRD